MKVNNEKSLDHFVRKSSEMSCASSSLANCSKNSSGLFCRICHDTESNERLISPCRCAGSLALVHRTCIEKWLSTANNDKCELCCHKYNITKHPRPFVNWLCAPTVQDDQRNLVGDMICFLLLTPLATISTYLCASGATFYLQEKKSESIGLICLSVVLVSIYIIWVLLTVKYHFSVWYVWREKNQVIRLTSEGRSPVSATNWRNPYGEVQYLDPGLERSSSTVSSAFTEHGSVSNKGSPCPSVLTGHQDSAVSGSSRASHLSGTLSSFGQDDVESRDPRLGTPRRMMNSSKTSGEGSGRRGISPSNMVLHSVPTKSLNCHQDNRTGTVFDEAEETPLSVAHCVTTTILSNGSSPRLNDGPYNKANDGSPCVGNLTTTAYCNNYGNRGRTDVSKSPSKTNDADDSLYIEVDVSTPISFPVVAENASIAVTPINLPTYVLTPRTDVMALNHYKEEETSPNNTEHTSSVDTAQNGARRPSITRTSQMPLPSTIVSRSKSTESVYLDPSVDETPRTSRTQSSLPKEADILFSQSSSETRKYPLSPVVLEAKGQTLSDSSPQIRNDAVVYSGHLFQQGERVMEPNSKKAEEGTVSSASSRHFFNKLVAEEKASENGAYLKENYARHVLEGSFEETFKQMSPVCTKRAKLQHLLATKHSLAYASPAATTVSEATAPTRPAIPTVAVRLPGLAGPPVETNSRVSPNLLSRKLTRI